MPDGLRVWIGRGFIEPILTGMTGSMPELLRTRTAPFSAIYLDGLGAMHVFDVTVDAVDAVETGSSSMATFSSVAEMGCRAYPLLLP